MVVCNFCHVDKPQDDIVKGTRKCKQCQKKYLDEHYRNRKAKALQEKQDGILEKLCNKCNFLRNVNNFKTGTETCKLCIKEYTKNLKAKLLKEREDSEIVSKQCTKCSILRHVDDFGVAKNICNHCDNARRREYANTSTSNYLGEMLNSAQKSAKKRSENGRKEAGTCNLNLEDLETLVQNQHGLCYYSNLELSFKKFSDWQCSLERLDPTKGYTSENVALIALEFQTATQWTIHKFTEFIRLINIEHVYQVVSWSINTTHLDLKGYRETPHGHIKKLFDGSKRRGYEDSDLTINDLIELFEYQGGLCAYSGIPMTFGSYHDKWWTCSPERIDGTKGYTKSNVCLICYEFNTPDRTKTAAKPEDVSGSSKWSIEKINYIKSMHLRKD
jgi:hypothetical protein